MTDTTAPDRPLGDERAFEAWKHYAAAGGADKDRMIQIATLLLGFSAAIAGFIFDHAVKGSHVTEPLAAAGLSIGGMIVAFASALVTLLYGGYANRNWARAERIARSSGWFELQRANTRNQPRRDSTDTSSRWRTSIPKCDASTDGAGAAAGGATTGGG